MPHVEKLADLLVLRLPIFLLARPGTIHGGLAYSAVVEHDMIVRPFYSSADDAAIGRHDCLLLEWSGVEWSGVEWSGVEWSVMENRSLCIVMLRLLFCDDDYGRDFEDDRRMIIDVLFLVFSSSL
jgi:hypothetical protein